MLYWAFHMQMCLLQGPSYISQFFNFTLSRFNLISNISLWFSSQHFIESKSRNIISSLRTQWPQLLTPYLQYPHWACLSQGHHRNTFNLLQKTFRNYLSGKNEGQNFMCWKTSCIFSSFHLCLKIEDPSLSSHWKQLQLLLNWRHSISHGTRFYSRVMLLTPNKCAFLNAVVLSLMESYIKIH